MQTLGEIERMWRYPVKSLAAEPLDSAEIAAGGIPGDRGRALFAQSDHARAGKTYRGKENRFLHLTGSADRALELAREAGAQVRIEQEESHYFDAAPISIVFDVWLNEASALVGYELEPLRYRPNVFVRARPEFAGKEIDYTDAVLEIGSAVLQVREPIKRCVATTYDLRTGESDPNVLRAVAQHRDAILGIYCDVLEPGMVRRGDSVLRR